MEGINEDIVKQSIKYKKLKRWKIMVASVQ